jgi:hypothetical protein
MKHLFITFLTFFSISLFAQESEPKKWYTYIHGGAGTVNTPLEKGNLTSGKLGFEFRPIPYIGFGLGLGANQMKLKSKESPLTGILPLVLILGTSPSGGSSSGGNVFLPLLLLTALSTPSSVAVDYNNLGLDFNFHMNKDNQIDPYIGLGLIGGSCAGGVVCTVTGGEVRLGLQVNFDTFFTFFQLQAQSLSFKLEGGSVNSSNKLASFGVGARF